MKKTYSKVIITFTLIFLSALFLLKSSIVNALELVTNNYPSETYCNAKMIVKPNIGHVYLGSNYEGWAATNTENHLYAVVKSLPKDLSVFDPVNPGRYNPDIIERWNFGDDKSWYPGSYLFTARHSYLNTGDYNISYFRGNTKTIKYLICKDTIKVYKPVSVSGNFGLVSNGTTSKVFTPTAGQLGGMYYTTSNYLQNNGSFSCFEQKVISSPELYNYSQKDCFKENLTWLVNLSQGVNKATVSVNKDPQYSGSYGMVIRNVVLYQRAGIVTKYQPKLSLPSGFSY